MDPTRAGAAKRASRVGRKTGWKMTDHRPTTQTPPLTKRGCFTPTTISEVNEPVDKNDSIVFHLDYLKLTVFAELEQVQQAVESGLFDPAHVEYGPWEDDGPGKRWKQILRNVGPTAILVPKYVSAGFCQVELKGEACAKFSSEQLQGLMQYLTDSEYRWHSSRVDLAFDHVAFSPHMIRDAIERRDFNSRCLRYEDRDWNENHEGTTAYLGQRRGRKDRKLRVYDKRGYNRCEAEFMGHWARTAVRHLASTSVAEWPAMALSLIRGMVDFVDSSANERIERCALLPWWSDFVGDVDKIRQLDDEDRRKHDEDIARDTVAEADRRITRTARQLLPIAEALGVKFLYDRLNHHGAKRLRPEDEQFIVDLRRAGQVAFANLPSGEIDFTPF